MLEVANVFKRYGETVALDDVSIAFEPGTIHTILGENGSGKSTLVKLLSGIVLPDAGDIRLNERSLRGRTPAEFQAAGVATVFQEVLVAPDRTVSDNILLGYDRLFRRRIPRQERSSRARQAIEQYAVTQVPLEQLAGDMPLATQQLIVLARALVREPSLLILDEVTAALDFADRESVFALMRRRAEANNVVIFITHRMDEVIALSDRVSVLRGGRLVRTLERVELDPDELLTLMAPEMARELQHA